LADDMSVKTNDTNGTTGASDSSTHSSANGANGDSKKPPSFKGLEMTNEELLAQRQSLRDRS